MTRIGLLILGVMAVDKALVAAPANLRDQATVIKWKPDFTCDTLQAR